MEVDRCFLSKERACDSLQCQLATASCEFYSGLYCQRAWNSWSCSFCQPGPGRILEVFGQDHATREAQGPNCELFLGHCSLAPYPWSLQPGSLPLRCYERYLVTPGTTAQYGGFLEKWDALMTSRTSQHLQYGCGSESKHHQTMGD